MGLISSTLLGPVKLLAWTAQQVLDVAEAQRNDEAAIRAQLVTLNEQLDAGEIDEEAFEQAEDVLMDRLMTARREERR